MTAARSVGDDEDESEQLIAATEAVRERARRLAKAALPESGPAIELIDSLQAPDQLADTVIGNMQCPVADKARYAAQPDAFGRLSILASLLDAQLAMFANASR